MWFQYHLLVWNTRGWTSTPRVATYFFSNSPEFKCLRNASINEILLPVRCLLTKVVFPVPPSPTSTSLKVGMSSPVAIMSLKCFGFV